MRRSYLGRRTQPTEKQIRERKEEANREQQVRDMKDLANEPYMGKNE